MKVSIATPNLKAQTYDERKVCKAHGYRTVNVESDAHFIQLLNNYYVVFGELKDGHRSGASLVSHAPCFQIDSDDAYADDIKEKLDIAGVKYIIVPSGSFDPIERPNKLHFVVYVKGAMSHYRAGYRYQVEEALGRLGIPNDWIDVNAQYDVARYFAPASIGELDADTIDEYSDVYGDYAMEVVEPPKEYENVNADAKSLKTKGKTKAEIPIGEAKGKYTLLPFNGYIYHIENGWVRYTDVANELKSENDRIGRFACPVCASGFDSVTGEQKDWKIPYAFAFKSKTGGELMFKCTGNHCASKPLYVADGVYVGLGKLCGAIRREANKNVVPFLHWEKFDQGLMRVYYNADKKQFIGKENGTFAKLDASNVIFWINSRFKFYDMNGFAEWCEANDRNFDKEHKSFNNMVLQQIKIIHQFEELVTKVDPFREAGLFLEDKTLLLRYDKINIRPPESPKPKNYVALVNDYKKQFKELDSVIEFICACRFSKSRRRSFMYIRVSAGFGKSFFMSILKNINVGFETDMDKLKVSSASDLSPENFTNSFVLAIDEFTHFGKELKKLTHEIVISPKFKMAQRVELYGKIFFSAEKSMTYYGEMGIDKQIADRTVMMDFGDVGNLDERELYKKSSAEYASAIGWYIYSEVKRKIEDYIAMGEIPSSNKADIILKEFKGNIELKDKDLQHTLSENLTDELSSLVMTFNKIRSDWWSEAGKSAYKMLPPWKREILDLSGVTASGDFVIRNGSKVFELLLKSLDWHSEKTASYKRGDFVAVLGLKEQLTRRFKTLSGDEDRAKCYIFTKEAEQEF